MGLLPIIYLIWFKPKCEKCEEKEIVVEKPVKKVVKKKAVKKKTTKKKR